MRVLPGPPLTGTVLGGRYEVAGLIGRGGMAEVYEAVDRVLARRVAVKVLRDGLANDQRFLARFRREARAAAALTHPGIVAVHDVGFEGGLPFLVMELVPGRSLAEVIHHEAPFPAPRAAAIGEQVAAALAFAHNRGIVHRDVTPGNVILMPGGAVKVLDFGISRATMWTPVTASPAPHGTAAYVAPEQVSGGEADPRADVYSLGVVLYEMLAGRPPFTGEGATAVAWQHVHQAPLPLRSLVPEVPEAMERIVLRCLAKDPARRYRHAEDLRADLARVRGSATLVAAGPEAVAADGAPATTATRPQPRPEDETRPAWTAPVTMERRAERDARPPRRTGRRVVGALVSVLALGAGALVATQVLREPPARSAPEPPASPEVPPPLFAPRSFAAAGSCDGFFAYRIDLSWIPSESPFADGYEILRADQVDGPYELIAVLEERGAVTYSDHGLGGDNAYHYKIRSTAGSRVGPASKVASATTPLFCLA